MNDITVPVPAPSNPGPVTASGEGALHKKLRENCAFFLLLGALVGAGFALCFCQVHGRGINVLVFSVLWLCCQQAAFRRLGMANLRRDAFPMAGIFLLSVSVFWTANSFVQLVSCVGIFLLMAMLLLDAFGNTTRWSLGKYISAFFHLAFTAITKLPEPFRHILIRRASARGKGRYILLGLLIAVPLCAAAVALLSSADVIFRRLMDDLFRFPRDLSPLWETVLRALGCFLCGFLLFFCSLSAQADRPPADEVKTAKQAEPLIAITFTGALGLIYLVFCSIQVVFLFTGGIIALPDGYTYAEYAREGFFQLLFVSGLNLLLVLLCARRFRASRVLRLLLTVISGCTYIMAASSAMRMLLYVQAYGLTFLRVLVLWFLAVLGILLAGTVVSIYKKDVPLLRFFLTVCLAMWLLFAFGRADRAAAEYNFSRFGADDRAAANAIYELSMDAVPVMARYSHDGNLSMEWKGYLENSVPREYEAHGVRGFNLALWQAYHATEDHHE